ncbi:TBP-complexed protein [Scheffersomyces xylosifermentans]|uniref:TBP-complexed protein n=1 Tax=Scheffersomyces xylosifermentans TaxID=1304137 RepID=UPI00315DE2D4
MDESFHFALLRISIAQILKANGFEKCKPSLLNVITDIAIQYFKKLIQQSLKCSQLRNQSNHVELQDISQALILVEAIKPDDYLKLDTQEDSKYNVKSLESFVNWTKYSDSFRVSRSLNEFPNELIRNLIEKRKLDLDDGETDQEKKKRKHKERQEYYNQLKLNDITNLQGDFGDEDEDDEYGISAKDKLLWLNYLIEKDLKLGHDLKFLNSTLADEFLKFQGNLKFHPIINSNNDEVHKKYQQFKHQLHNLNKHDYVVISIDNEKEGQEPISDMDVRPSESLIKLLPYNLKYDKHLLDDDLDQYFEYRQRHSTVDEADQNDIYVEENNDHYDSPSEDLIIQEEGIGGENSLMLT